MAEATYYQDGDTLDYTPSGADVEAGQVINLGDGLVGVAPRDFADGVAGAVQVRGVVKATKAAGSITFGVGDQVDWDDTGNTAVATGGDFRLGVAAYAAAATDDHVYVILNQNVATAAAV